MRTKRAVRSLAVIAVSVLALAACNRSAPAESAAHALNGTRTESGLGALAPHGDLDVKAQAWAEHLAARGGLAHSNLADGAPADWRRLGENVGKGASIEAIHAAFLDSPGHADNILDGGYSHVGIGVAKAGGHVYVVQVFMQA